MVDKCCICLKDLKTNVLSLECGCKFHDKCIYKWINMKDSCPLCSNKISNLIKKKAAAHKSQLTILKELIENEMDIVFRTCLSKDLVNTTIEKILRLNYTYAQNNMEYETKKMLGRTLLEYIASAKKLNRVVNGKFNMTFYGVDKLSDTEIKEESRKMIADIIKDKYEIGYDNWVRTVKIFVATLSKNSLDISKILKMDLQKPRKSNLDLSYLDLSGIEMNNIQFSSIGYGHVNFTGSNLMNVRTLGNGCTNTCIHGIFTDADCQNMIFGRHCIKTSLFKNTNLRNVDFSAIINWGLVKMVDSDLTGAFIKTVHNKVYKGFELKQYLEDEHGVEIKNCIFGEEISIKKLQNKIKDITLCQICMENKKNRVIVPCGHTLCAQCEKSIKNKCPFCRTIVDKIITLYL
jgi:uncharacterized protein YjbI with pentapeptide repeats